MAVIVNPEINQVIPDTNTQNYIPMSIGMVKGDIIVCKGEGNFVRLQVGTEGQVLTVDPNSELGVKWA